MRCRALRCPSCMQCTPARAFREARGLSLSSPAPEADARRCRRHYRRERPPESLRHHHHRARWVFHHRPHPTRRHRGSRLPRRLHSDTRPRLRPPLDCRIRSHSHRPPRNPGPRRRQQRRSPRVPLRSRFARGRASLRTSASTLRVHRRDRPEPPLKFVRLRRANRHRNRPKRRLARRPAASILQGEPRMTSPRLSHRLQPRRLHRLRSDPKLPRLRPRRRHLRLLRPHRLRRHRFRPAPRRPRIPRRHLTRRKRRTHPPPPLATPIRKRTATARTRSIPRARWESRASSSPAAWGSRWQRTPASPATPKRAAPGAIFAFV